MRVRERLRAAPGGPDRAARGGVACGFFAGQGIGPLLIGPLLHAFGARVALVAVAIALVGLGRVVVAQVIDRHAAP